MPTHFHDEDDLKSLREMKELAPEDFRAWAALDGIIGRADGQIPQKYRELIAIAVAHTTQCPYCIEAHTKKAKKAGASKAEIAEAIFVAMALRAGGSWAHSAVAMRALEE